MNELCVFDLQKKYNEKKKRKIEIFDKIYEKCQSRIKLKADAGDNYCIFLVPDFQFGHPTYNLPLCAAYIIYKLRKNGFNVGFFDPNVILIKWTIVEPKFDNSNQNMYLMPNSHNETKNLSYDMPKLLPITSGKKNNCKSTDEKKHVQFLF